MDSRRANVKTQDLKRSWCLFSKTKHSTHILEVFTTDIQVYISGTGDFCAYKWQQTEKTNPSTSCTCAQGIKDEVTLHFYGTITQLISHLQVRLSVAWPLLHRRVHRFLPNSLTPGVQMPCWSIWGASMKPSSIFTKTDTGRSWNC